jgi:MOSC domain-containing protein YiiM
MGTIQSIVIRPEKKGPTVHLQEAVIHSQGIEGDHFVRPETQRSVTLVSARDLAEAAAAVGFEGDAHAACRRNILVDDFPEPDMVGKRLALGDDVIVEVTCYCFPCKRMDENFGDGAVKALDMKAGWGAIVLREGTIRVGDTYRVL